MNDTNDTITLHEMFYAHQMMNILHNNNMTLGRSKKILKYITECLEEIEKHHSYETTEDFFKGKKGDASNDIVPEMEVDGIWDLYLEFEKPYENLDMKEIQRRIVNKYFL